MRHITLNKKITATFATMALAAGIFLSAGVVRAIPYTGATTQPSPIPAFNVFTGVDQGVGDESDFLRSRVPVTNPDTATLYTDSIAPTCTDGQNIQMRVYVHNGASADNNNNGTGASVAHGTTVKVALPTNEGSTLTANASISATNAATVNDTTTINCNGKLVKLSYVAGSAKANSISTGTVAVSDAIVTTGVPISSHGVAGDVWGCWDDRVYIILTVKVEEVKPVYTCDVLTVSKLADNKYRFSVTYTAKNGATFTNVSYDFGDGTKTTTGATVDHTYTAASAVRNVIATVNFMVSGTAKTDTNANCAKQVTLTKDNCTIAGKENLPKNSPDCKVTKLPDTGAGSTIAAFMSATFIGAFMYRLRALRSVSN